MDIFSSLSYINALSPTFTEKITDGNNYVIYMGWAQNGDSENCLIKKITYTDSGTGTETWSTEFANGRKDFDNNWANRAALSYSTLK